MVSHEELTARAAATYNAAADWFDAPENSFWDRFGTRTVERLGLQPGMRVLDVCSGSGASAIPAAEAVGPTGHVVAIDIADELLARLRAKAELRGLGQLDVRAGDFLHTDPGGSAFDAVVCVFGIFFVADMTAGVRQLWRRVAPGGQLAITTWGPRLFEPANTQFWDAVRLERPDLYKQFNPWDTITEPDALQHLLTSAGVPDAQMAAEPGRHALASPSAWWALVMGSGYRGTLEQLTPSAREHVKTHNLSYLAAAHISEVETNVLYAVARKSAVSRR
jgi:ubiquinone/menaquinone biosynthesis C-methylase UbiE